MLGGGHFANKAKKKMAKKEMKKTGADGGSQGGAKKAGEASGASRKPAHGSALKGPIVQYATGHASRDSGNDRHRVPFTNKYAEKEYKKLHRIPSHQSVFDRNQSEEEAQGNASGSVARKGTLASGASPSSRLQGASSQAQRRRVLRKKGDEDLLDHFKSKLTASKFRYLNGMIYSSPNAFASQLLSDAGTFNDYHTGYRLQLSQWPMNPNTLIVESLTKDKRGRFLLNKKKSMPGSIPPNWVIADMGCGDALVAQQLKQHGCHNPVHSFDFVAANELVTVADSTHVPLEADSVDVCVFSLSLMATDYLASIIEAFRVLKPKRLLKIIEVRSRIPHPQKFADLVAGIGFETDFYDVVGDYFVAYDFIKRDDCSEPYCEPVYEPSEVLVPSLYKKR